MEWRKATKKEENLYEIPRAWLYPHYYDALTVLFRIENALRLFVFTVLKKELQDKWSDLNITSDDSEEGTIKSIARKRITQASTFGYLGFTITCPVMHLTSGELIRLITSNSYWKYFKDFFSGGKEIIKNKLDEIGNIRNSLAHFRPIKEDDVEVIKQNAKQVLTKIEECISEMTVCRNVVPTNTSDEWYNHLKTVKTEYCVLTFNQSRDEQWVKITLGYNCPIISETKYPKHGFTQFRVLNLVSSSILKEYPVLAKFVIYLSEKVSASSKNMESGDIFRKDVSVLFSKKVICEHYKDIKDQIEGIALTISKEIDLIKEDNLARGKLIEIVKTFAILKKGEKSEYWLFNPENLNTEIREGDPEEYWGVFDCFGSNFISETGLYPWMPVIVSEYEIPF